MKLNTKALADLAKQGIERAKAAQVEWDANVDAAEAEWERAWREEKLPRWKPFRDELTKAFKTGGKITAEMLPVHLDRYGNNDGSQWLYRPFNRGRMGGYSRDRWEADHDFGPRPTLDIFAFETLGEFLEAVDEETVSTAALERLGFRNLSKLFDAASHGRWT